jgi:hypothetical protein
MSQEEDSDEAKGSKVGISARFEAQAAKNKSDSLQMN